jgi:hypothetical protein
MYSSGLYHKKFDKCNRKGLKMIKNNLKVPKMYQIEMPIIHSFIKKNYTTSFKNEKLAVDYFL